MAERLENLTGFNLSHNLDNLKPQPGPSLLEKLFGEQLQELKQDLKTQDHNSLLKQTPAPDTSHNPALQQLAAQRCSAPYCDCSAAYHCFAYTTGQFMPPAQPDKRQAPWKGVDLDGTLAHYDGWKGIDHIGEPIPAMVARVRAWLAKGERVKIFTARVFDPAPEVLKPIEAWCRLHLGMALPVTCVKDMAMTELWDDRAVQVNINTGQRADGKE